MPRQAFGSIRGKSFLRSVGMRRQLGYYMFLGQGDYWEAAQPLAQWNLARWLAFLRTMETRGLNTLWLLVNGFALAYPSRRYPDLLDPQACNARTGFLRALIDAAHERGIRVHLVHTTD